MDFNALQSFMICGDEWISSIPSYTLGEVTFSYKIRIVRASGAFQILHETFVDESRQLTSDFQCTAQNVYTSRTFLKC